MSNVFLSIGTGVGIGLNTARRFAGQGYKVVLAARDTQRLEALADIIRQGKNAGVEIAAVDCAIPSQVAALVERFACGLRVVHYNAASLRRQTLAEQSLLSLETDMAVSLTSALVAIKQAGAVMDKQGGGTILLTGGILGVQPVAQFFTLSIGKSGLRTAAQALFADYQTRNIHIVVLTIGTVIHPESESVHQIAERFWELHRQPKEQWHWESHYG